MVIIINKIGIIDSGLGGINVLKYLLGLNKFAHYIFYGDYKNNPYGNKKNEDLKRYYQNAIEFLKNKNCQTIIIACNTLSFVADENAITPIKIVKNIIKNYSLNECLLLATDSTIKNKIYDIEGVGCSKFVPLIENGVFAEIDNFLDYYLKKYKSNKKIIILGCTHYSLLKEKISNYFNNDIIIIDSSLELAKNINFESKNLKIDIYLTKVYVSCIKNIQKILNNYDYTIYL